MDSVASNNSFRFVSLLEITHRNRGSQTGVIEVFQLREMLLVAFRQGYFSYVVVSLFCVAAAIVSAASTTIANHTIVKNSVVRRTDVSGRLAQERIPQLTGLNERVTERAQALERAGAPHDQLFDFMPDDYINWVYVPEEWNNSWKGQCVFHKYPAVDLVVHSTMSLVFQDLVPALGPLLPSWATLDPDKQGLAAVNSPQGNSMNNTGATRDGLLTYVFGSATIYGNDTLPTTNISFANFLAHDIGHGSNGTWFTETALKSDVYVAECTFNNTAPGDDQALANDGGYVDAASALTSVSVDLIKQLTVY
jgi:hypothetical protein